MPLLKFRCKSCQKVFDALTPVSRMHDVRCEACGAEVERAYEGACLFGMAGSSAGRGACAGDCGSCSSGCGSSHGGGCQCGACH